MKTITIDRTQYNLDFLVRFSYKQTAIDEVRKGRGFDEGFDTPTGELKFRSTFEIEFAHCSPILFENQEADIAWKSFLESVNPLPIVTLSTKENA